MASTGESWNQFKLIEPLGGGGMGQVFLAEDSRTAVSPYDAYVRLV